MAFYRRMLSPRDEDFEPWNESNSSSEATPPPYVDTVSISFTDHNRYLANVVTIAISVITSVFFVSLVCYVYLVCRRRRQRLIRPLLPHAAAAAAAAAAFPPSDYGEEFHPIWYIRTVGLDEATIRSVAVAEYKAGDGLLGVTDCSVCLGEFQDGELVRLLPKCGHAFHVPCIDTWLRAHVNCPLCRANIVDSAVDPAGAASPPPASATPAAISVEVSSSLAPTENPNVGIQAPEGDHGGQDREEEDRGLETGIGTGILTDQLPESSELRVQGDLVEGGFQPIRRSASMDSPFLGPQAEESSGEEGKDPNFGSEQGIMNEGKQGNSSKDRITSRSRSTSFFSRHRRVPRNSILPL